MADMAHYLRSLRYIVSIVFSLFFIEKIPIPYIDSTFSLDSTISVLTLIFVIISETWIWIMRLKLLNNVKFMRLLGDRYNLSSKPNNVIKKP